MSTQKTNTDGRAQSLKNKNPPKYQQFDSGVSRIIKTKSNTDTNTVKS